LKLSNLTIENPGVHVTPGFLISGKISTELKPKSALENAELFKQD